MIDFDHQQYTMQNLTGNVGRACLSFCFSFCEVQAADWAQHRIVCNSFLRANKEAEELEAQQQHYHAQAIHAKGVPAISLPPALGYRLLAPIVPDLARCTR